MGWAGAGAEGGYGFCLNYDCNAAFGMWWDFSGVSVFWGLVALRCVTWRRVEMVGLMHT